MPKKLQVQETEFMSVGEIKTFDGLRVEMISASHNRPPASPSPLAAGYALEFEGRRIAHLGGTFLDGVKRLSFIDVLLVPIGGGPTMDVDEAVKALRIIKPKLAVPMHFQTFRGIRAGAERFRVKADEAGFQVKVLRIGEYLKL